MPKRKGYTRQDLETVEAVLSHPTRAAAARALGISRSALNERLRRESVRQLIDEVVRERVQHLSRHSLTIVERALERLREMLESENELIAYRAASTIVSKFAPVLPEIVSDDIEVDDDLSG